MKIKRILAVALMVLMLAMTMTSCGMSDSEKVAAYLEASSESIESSFSAFESYGFEVDYYAEDCSIVLELNIGVEVEDVDAMATQLDTALDSAASAMNTSVAQMKEECPEVESLILVYVDKDGTELTSKEFK